MSDVSSARPPATAGRVVGVIAPAVVLTIGMVAAVNLAIPRIQASALHPSLSGTAWVVDSYTLVFACLLIPAGALGDRFGRKRGMLLGLTLFALGSLIAGAAPSVAVLMGGRALSGIGAAMVLPATLAVALAQLEPAQRPKAVAQWSALTGIAGVVGNLGGGVAVQLGGWRVLFLAGVPLALAAAALIARAVPNLSPHRDPVDGGGALLLTAASVALLFGIIDGPQLGWGSWQVLGSLGLSVVLFVGFVAYELTREHPMLDPRLFRVRGVWLGSLGIMVMFFGLFGLFYVNAQYLQDVKGDSALLAGICIIPVAVFGPWLSPRSILLAARIGARATIILGLALMVLGLGWLSCATRGTPYSLYVPGLLLAGWGLAIALPTMSHMIVGALPSSHAGVGAGLNSTTREFGSSLGVAVFSTLLAGRFHGHLSDAIAHQPASQSAFISGFSIGLRVGAALILLALIALLIQRSNPQPQENA